MEKCTEKLVVLESFDHCSSGSKSTSQSTADNLVYQQLNDLNIDENIILCWENYSVPLQELVKSLSNYEKNMIEYYR